MTAIKPRTGEHPLATKCRELHRELAYVWALLAVLDICLTVLSFTLGGVLAGFIGSVLCVGFATFAHAHLRWSR